jgi:hypothetical protein
LFSMKAILSPSSGIAAPCHPCIWWEPGGFGYSCQKAGKVHEFKVEDNYSLFVNMHTFQQIPGFSA